MGNWVVWIGAAALLLLMLFTTLNLVLRSPSRVRLAEAFAKLGREDRLESFALVRPECVLATAVVRTTAAFLLVVISLYEAGALSGEGEVWRAVVGGVVCLALILVFGVAIPNAWAKYTGESLIVRLLPLLWGVRGLCYPVTVFLSLFDPLVRRLAGVPVRDKQSYADELEREILNVVSEGELHGAVDEEEKEMIESVIELSDTRVDQIMTPRTEIIAVPKDADLDAVLKTIRRKGHSRIPLYDDTIDGILGVLYAKDLLLRDESVAFDVTRIMRRALFIPESKLVRDLLREMQSQKVHMAVVLDEYGGTAGLVTIEDILEELVGEIADEYDPTVQLQIKRIDEHTVEVDARMRIDDLNDQLDLELPEDGDYETIGGLVFSQMGRIPLVGESCVHESVDIRVIAAEPRRITRLQLTLGAVGENSRAAG